MYPASMFTKGRVVRAKGLVKSPRISTGMMIGREIAHGAPPVMCLELFRRHPAALMGANWVRTKVQSASDERHAPGCGCGRRPGSEPQKVGRGGVEGDAEKR